MINDKWCANCLKLSFITNSKSPSILTSRLPTAVNALMMHLKCTHNNPDFWNFLYTQRLIIKILCSDTLDIFIRAFSKCVVSYVYNYGKSHVFSI